MSSGSRSRLLAQYEHHELLSKRPLWKELFTAVANEDTRKIVELVTKKQIDLREDRSYTKLLMRTAIENDNDKVLEILVNDGAKIGGFLFTAVRLNSYKCIKKILIFLTPSSAEDGDLGPSDTKDEGFITPLMMAIHSNNHVLIEFLTSQGYQLKDHEDEYQENTKNDLDINLVKITKSMGIKVKTKPKRYFPKEHSVLLRINQIKAFANPLYISYRFIHERTKVNPMFEIFCLNLLLQKQARLDEEFKEQYKEQSDQCEEFAVDLMEQCRTFKEIKVLTDVLPELERKKKHIEVHKENAKDLTFLNLAIKGNNDRLIAHPYSQLCLNTTLYKNIYTIFSSEPHWRDRTNLSVIGYLLRHILLLPFMAIVHIIVPSKAIREVLGNPMVKFMSHFWSNLCFVALLILSAFQDMFDNEIMSPTIPEWLLLAWLVGMIVQEFKELWTEGKRRYFDQWWNVITFTMLIFFIVSYILRLVAYGITGNWAVLDPIKDFTPSAWYKVILLANSLFSIGMVLSFIRLSAVFQANDMLGPLQLSLYHLVLDVFKFMVFFVMIFIAFGFSLRKLYSHYISTQKYIRVQRQQARNSSSHNGTDTETNHAFSDVGSGLYGLFWSLFGLTELQSFSTKDKNFAITKETGEVLFALFQVVTVIVAINMLIAMMTRSYDDIASNAVIKWKVSRTRLWMFWLEKGSILPPPLNLIPNAHFIISQLKGICKCCQQETFNVDITDGFEVGKNIPSVDSWRNRKLKEILKRYIGMRKAKGDDKYTGQDMKNHFEATTCRCNGCSNKKGYVKDHGTADEATGDDDSKTHL